jgi:large subunit ribosomal protein L30
VAAATVVITQRRSANGSSRTQRETLRSLGLRGIGSSVERRDGPELRGMLRVVDHLVAFSDRATETKSKGDGATQTKTRGDPATQAKSKGSAAEGGDG